MREKRRKGGWEGKRGEFQSKENFLEIIWYGPLALLSEILGLIEGHTTGQ